MLFKLIKLIKTNLNYAFPLGAQRVYGVLEPTVVDEELLTSACFAQGPKGEAGRLAEEEGIAFDSVEHLALSYQSMRFQLSIRYPLPFPPPQSSPAHFTTLFFFYFLGLMWLKG